MGKLRQTALILGEGPTEFFYFKSLCDVFKRLTIKPDYPKHTNIKELEAKIAEGVAIGYSHIFCIIDMDTKDKEPERSRYQKLKAKYAKPIDKPKKGIYCEVEYRKTIEFFIKTKGLHGYFERNDGNLEKAAANAYRSVEEKLQDGRDYTYSELGRLMEELKGLEV